MSVKEQAIAALEKAGLTVDEVDERIFAYSPPEVLMQARVTGPTSAWAAAFPTVNMYSLSEEEKAALMFYVGCGAYSHQGCTCADCQAARKWDGHRDALSGLLTRLGGERK